MKRTDLKHCLKEIEPESRKQLIDMIMILNHADVEKHKKSLAEQDKKIRQRDSAISVLTKKLEMQNNAEAEILREELKNWQKKYSEDLAAVKKIGAIQQAIMQIKPRNEKALMAMLDTKIVKLNEDGKMTGLEEQLSRIRQDNAFLFEDDSKEHDKGLSLSISDKKRRC